MMKRRAFLGGTLSVVGVGSSSAQPATAIPQNAAIQALPEPLVWPVVTKLRPGIRSFDGHTDTVPDIVGRIGTPPSLVIFTEGNHLMVLLSDDIIGAFPSWAKSQTQYADLDLDNIVVVTLPQPVVIQMIRTGGIALGNLTLDVSRKSGFYRHRDTAVSTLIPALLCRSCRPNAPFAELVRLSPTSIADEMREEYRRRVLGR
jgi:hypothetical protein